ncbi:AbiH family protein [Arenibacter troitsensis]|uniref:Bacteriophage abortive infection AbiH n=1 Tax=Arenibacter troitsensis TaxID=188872 RepID=A0A1X7L7A6_9FLAO|nr:AbiH family protein [Arenibacter troitsensis]SMG49726.1 Bacteriophage abortive infection AbiH [Arenibacter troitsensis]
MNRIILIGNGFDRSLNMPTSYSHFLDWLMSETLANLLKHPPESYKGDHYQFKVENEIFDITINSATFKWVQTLPLKDFKYRAFMEEIKRLEPQSIFLLKLRPKHGLIYDLFDFYNKNSWVNVEELYFLELLKTKQKDVIELNEYFELIKSKLAEYLKELDFKDNNVSTFSKYRKHFFGPVIKYNSTYQLYEDSNDDPEWYYFVNFNYTQFLSKLLTHTSADLSRRIRVNNIHGEINVSPIIFGYGNETGDEYLRLESQSDEYLENIKSTHYFNSTDYRDLETQLHQPYEVYIYGLSCGLSDNILLKTLMQKSNCKQIRIFYKKSKNNRDNFRNILMNISRALEDKEDMRSKIISKQTNDVIPQLGN